MANRKPGSSARAAGDRIRLGNGGGGIERLEAHLHGQAFAPHRHDTYAIGITLSGVQTFGFRGRRWECLPGQCHILHPDELHDGAAGTEEGFSYRIVYVEPALVRDALGGGPLPFVANPVIDGARLLRNCDAGIWDMDAEIDDVARADIAVMLSNLLSETSAQPVVTSGCVAMERVSRVRDLIAASPAERHSLEALERASGLDRWTLARQFRAAFGTSPSRFRVLRRLDGVRGLLRQGVPPAHAAVAAGFADQSHMSRQFKRAYGLTPARWAAALG